MQKNKIVYGDYIFQDDDFKSGNLFQATSLLSSQLQVNSFEATVKCTDPAIRNFERNAKLTYYYDNRQVGIFRVQDIRRAGPEIYAISSTSTLGLLTEGQHMGGIYTGQTAEEIISSICGTVPFEIKHNLAGIKLYGWLPIATPRDNLAQVLFAIGAALKTDLDGVLRIEGLWDGISGTITRDHIYTDATVDYDSKVTQVIVLEHQYVPWTEEKQLFEGTAQEGDIITFDEPMHSLTANGFSIRASGANWAKVSAGSGILSGKTYLHNTRQISKDVWSANEPNIKTVKEATLVSLVNSQACAQRLADYYKCRERVDASVVYQGESPGDRLSTYHPFDKIGVVACLESADITLSNTLKAKEKSLVGFVPKQIEQTVTYDHHEVLTGSGVWKPPEGVTKVLAVLIGGGGAGFSGSSGANATGGGWADGSKYKTASNSGSSSANISTSASSSNRTTAQAGKGGKGGTGGTPGKIYQVEYEIKDQTPIQYSCGYAGNSNGALGGNTVFGNISSQSGEIGIGYTDLISGITYALPGVAGSNGGDGGSSGADGASVGGASGGAGLFSFSDSENRSNSGWSGEKGYYSNIRSTHTYSLGGAGGGGAGGNSGNTPGNNGGNGSRGRVYCELSAVTSGSSRVYPYAYTSFGASHGGSGGDGAKGASGITFGSAGNGGGGGGGGGALDSSSVSTSISANAPVNGRVEAGAITTDNNSGGTGGTGGAGGSGAPGCIILYYGVQKKVPTGQLADKNNRMVLDRLGRRIIM